MEPANLITFEMPANELVRIGLRFEYLKQFADKYVLKKTEQDSIVCATAIVEMLQLLDRPELRSKYFQEFSRFSIYLERLYHTKNIDQVKLHSIIDKLNTQMEKLNKHNGKFGNELRENVFFKTILQFSDKPGALCGFNTPGYFLWMHQPAEDRFNDLKHWLSYFDDISENNQVLLQLIRGSGKHSTQLATDGFYQQAIDPKTPCHLVQLRVARELEVFPRISIDKHRITVIFLNATDLETETEKDHRNISFEIIICAL